MLRSRLNENTRVKDVCSDVIMVEYEDCDAMEPLVLFSNVDVSNFYLLEFA